MLEKPFECIACPLFKDGIGFQQNVITHGVTRNHPLGCSPHLPKAIFVGEALGAHEVVDGLPFVGSTGQMLRKMMQQAGISPDEVYITNTVKCRPPSNRTPNEAEAAYCAQQYLWKELDFIKPNVIVPVGGVALKTIAPLLPGITRSRGYVHKTARGKLIPIVHPAFVARGNSEFWSITVVDLIKARREWDTPEVKTYKENFIIHPALEDVRQFCHTVIDGGLTVSFDIETFGMKNDPLYLYNSNLACIGFATSSQDAICIPLLKRGGFPYWKSAIEEEEVVSLIGELLESPHITKIGQNIFSFDMPFLQGLGFKFAGECHDTLIEHHVTSVELKHSLEFLTSIYTDRFHHKGTSVTIWADNTELWTYNCRDCVATWDIHHELQKEIATS